MTENNTGIISNLAERQIKFVDEVGNLTSNVCIGDGGRIEEFNAIVKKDLIELPEIKGLSEATCSG